MHIGQILGTRQLSLMTANIQNMHFIVNILHRRFLVVFAFIIVSHFISIL